MHAGGVVSSPIWVIPVLPRHGSTRLCLHWTCIPHRFTDFISSQISLVQGLLSAPTHIFPFPPLHPPIQFLAHVVYLGLCYCLAGLLSPFPHPCPITPPSPPTTQNHLQATGELVLTSMGPDMSFQIKGVVEAFPAEGAQVSLHLAVTLDVTIEHPLQTKAFATQLTAMHCSIITGASGELRNGRGLGE